jgi:hypothetical protein
MAANCFLNSSKLPKDSSIFAARAAGGFPPPLGLRPCRQKPPLSAAR